MKRTIILVDDDPQSNLIHSKLLENHFQEVEIIALSNGKEFCDFIFSEGLFEARSPTNPDHIFLDILMPEMGGLEAMKKIKTRNYELFKSLKISVLTSLVSIQSTKELNNLSIINYIQKPLKPNTIQRLFENEK